MKGLKTIMRRRDSELVALFYCLQPKMPGKSQSLSSVALRSPNPFLLKVKYGLKPLLPYSKIKSRIFWIRLFLLAEEEGFGHVPRPPNYVYENKFSRVSSFPKCHWHFSPYRVRTRYFFAK